MTSPTEVNFARPPEHTSEYENLHVEHRGPISWIVLDRPTKANALSNALLDEFSDALARLAHEGGPVIGIRGRGRGFSAGYDIDQVGKVASAPIRLRIENDSRAT